MARVTKTILVIFTLILVLDTVFYLNVSNTTNVGNINVAYASEEEKEEKEDGEEKKSGGGGKRQFSYDLCASGWDGQRGSSGALRLKDADEKIIKQVWDAMKKGGLTDEQSAGVMGNIAHESRYDPAIIEKEGYGGFGLVQWTAGRRTNIEKYAKDKGEDVTDVAFQVSYIFHEFNTSHKTAYNHLKGTKTIDEAVLSFQEKFEIPDYYLSATACRGAFAYEVYDKYSGSGPSSNSGGDEESGGPADTPSNSGRGEITGNLEYDPFVKSGPVQNTTGIKTGDEGNIQATESFVVGQWIYILLDIIMIGILVLLAGFMVLMGVVVLLITFYNPMIANNKVFATILGEKTMQALAHDGVRGAWKGILVNFLLGAFLLMLAVTGYVNGIQVIILEFFIGLFP